MGIPQKWVVFKGKSHLEMDDDWGYPHFRKPPYIKKMVTHQTKGVRGCWLCHTVLEAVTYRKYSGLGQGDQYIWSDILGAPPPNHHPYF